MTMAISRRRFVANASGLLAAARVGAAAAQAKAPLKFGTSAGLNTAIMPCLYAQSAGLFDKYGLAVQFVDMADDTTAMQALIGGSCDMLYAGAGTGFVAIGRGADIKLVSSFTPWTDFVMIAQKGIEKLSDLNGKVVGISKVGALNYQATVFALRKGGVDPANVQFLATGTDAQRAQALAAGRINAGTVNGVAAVMAMDANKDLKKIYDVGAAFRDSFMSTAVFARGDLIKSRPQVVQAAVTALIEASRGLQGDKAVAKAAARAAGLPANSVDSAYDQLFAANVPYYGVDGGVSRSQVEGTIEILKGNGDIDKILPFDSVVDMRFVDAALKQVGPWRG